MKWNAKNRKCFAEDIAIGIGIEKARVSMTRAFLFCNRRLTYQTAARARRVHSQHAECAPDLSPTKTLGASISYRRVGGKNLVLLLAD